MGVDANFYFIDGKAYTEDHVLVFNVFVCNISRYTSRRGICQYFERYGEVANVQFLPGSIAYNRYKEAFVNFVDARHAANVLRNHQHRLNKRNLRVLPCNSWHQPDGRKTFAGIETECVSQQPPLMQLNDYCLEMIFGFLSITDQVNLVRADHRLKDILKMNARREFKVLKMEKIQPLTLWQARMFFEIAGPCIEQIVGPIPPKPVLKFIGAHCSNIKSIRFPDYGIINCKCMLTAYGLQVLVRHNSLITHIELENAFLRDDDINILSKLENLKFLSLAKNYDITGQYIAALTTVENLSLNNCRGVQSKFFIEICENLASLKSLDIENLCLLSTSDLRIMVDHMHQLETLKLSDYNVDVAYVALLPKLKNLHLLSYGLVSIQVFQALATHLKDQLELLELKGFYSISHEVISFINKITNLRILRCSSYSEIDDRCRERIANLRITDA